jgi:gliding motility-associated-like protein
MKNNYHTFLSVPDKRRMPLVSISLKVLLLIFITGLYPKTQLAQNTIPTKGKEFWLGFLRQNNYNVNSKRCDVFVTSEFNTSGVVMIPQQGWTLPFTVTANQTTTINLPLNMVEHTSSQTTDNKGILIQTLDTVSVFAISFQQYTADASVIYPKQSLGTEYRVTSYPGISNAPSEFLIVATDDNTQFTITPTAVTAAGNAIGVPFTVNLNYGQSYQVRASLSSADFTGTKIMATDSSGSCRPFAVFSGTTCVNIPAGCYACDMIFDQSLPVSHWGKSYYAAPFASTTKYTLRVLADQPGTQFSMNGGPPVNLNAGQVIEYNNITAASCITANKPVSVGQYMQGQTCSGAGDPALVMLNAIEQKIDQVTFSTVISNIINAHYVNVIMNTTHINQLRLNGAPVASSLFSPFPSCAGYSFAQLTLSQGSHTLDADSGFCAYVYGTGSFESYAYSAGSFSKKQPIQVDSVLCSSDTLLLGDPNSTLFGTWWSTVTNPTDTLGTGPLLMLVPPIIPDIYVLHGNEFISGCEREFYFSVEIPDPPQTWITSSASLACLNNTIQLNSGTNPPTPGFNYQWSPSTGLNNPNIANPVLTANTSGWYQVSISANNGCTPTVYDSIYIEVLPLPPASVNAGGNQSICYGTSTSLTATGGVSYQWLPGNISGNTITVNPLVTTNYVVLVTDSNGCFNSDTVTVVVNPLPNANAGNNSAVCLGSSTNLTASGGVNYVWNPGNISGNPISVSPQVATNFIVQVTDINGCVAFDTVLVNVNPLPVIDAGSNQTICRNDLVTLSATGGISYLWNPGNISGSTITVSPANTTNYIVSAIDANGCVGGDAVSVTVNQLPVVISTPDSTICNGQSLNLVVSGAVSYNWLPGNQTSSSITVTPGTTTSYIVTGTDANGCINRDTTSITVNPLPVIDAGAAQTICSGTPVSFTATGGLTYVWTPGNISGATLNVTPALTTTYVVTGTDLNNCSNSDSVVVSVNALPAISAGPDVGLCTGFSTILNASGGLFYSWTPGGSTGSSITVSPAATTNYIVTAVDGNGCQNSDTVVVSVYSLPLVSAGLNQSICIGQQATLTASGASNYTWSPGNYNGVSYTISPSASGSYTVTGTDVYGCSNTASVFVTVNPLPVVQVSNNSTICQGVSITLNASGGSSYLWSPGGLTGSVISVTPSITTGFTVLVTDINGCTNTGAVTVNVNPLPVANAGPDQHVCPGESATFTATGGISYIWNPGSINSGSITVTPTAGQLYTVLVTDINGCTQADTTYVGLHPLPVSEFTIVAPVCEKTPFQFTNLSYVSQGTITDYLWDFGDGTGSVFASPAHNYSAFGNYNIHLTIVTDKGCEDDFSHVLTVNPLPDVNFTTANACVGIPVNFFDLSSAAPNQIVSWNWNFGDGANIWWEQHPQHTYHESGYYAVTLTVTSDSGCISRLHREQAVFIHPLPEARFTHSPHHPSIMDPKVYFRDLSIGAVSWLWDFGDGIGLSEYQHPVYSYSDTGRFSVRLTIMNNEGCRDTIFGEVIINPYYTVYIPNAFTPNGDGINEIFTADGTGIRQFQMLIFDRWGRVQFNSDQLQKGWNGESPEGKPCMQGTYIYKIVLRDFNDVERELVGQVNLIR